MERRHIFPDDSRTTSGAGRRMRRGGRPESAMRSRSVLYAMCAMSAQGWCTVVSVGAEVTAKRTSSKPTSITSCGTETPNFASVLRNTAAT